MRARLLRWRSGRCSRRLSFSGSFWLAQQSRAGGGMTPETLFSILNMMTVAAWLALVLLPRLRWTTTLLPVIVPALLAVVYVVLIAASLPWSTGSGFSSLAGVSALFEN